MVRRFRATRAARSSVSSTRNTLAGLGAEARVLHHLLWHHTLQNGIHGGEHQSCGLWLSGERSKKAAVTRALEEFIARRRQKRLLELMGKLEWDPGYDYKAERSR